MRYEPHLNLNLKVPLTVLANQWTEELSGDAVHGAERLKNEFSNNLCLNIQANVIYQIFILNNYILHQEDFSTTTKMLALWHYHGN